MAGTIKGILVEIGGDTSGLQKALTKVNTATSSLSKELRGVNSLLKLDPKNIELTKQKQEILTKSIGETSKKLEELRKVEEMANSERDKISDENYRNLQREIANTEYKLKQLQVQASKWTKAGDNLEAFGNKVVSISGKLNNMGNTLTTSLTLPVLAIGTAAISTGNDFEAQMSRVQAIAGATKEELKKLTDLAVDLGAKTSFSASEVAAGMENLASAGFSTNEIIQAMPGLLDLAASSGAELAISSEIAASSIRGFGLEANKSGHVADVFAEASARTNAQVEDMGEAMKYVAPVAKTVGLSIEETAAAIGIMSDAGVKGSQAGTTLRGGLTRIVKPTKQVKEAMEELGVEFYNSNGTMKSLTQIIQTLQEHTKGLTDETKNQALAQIFGTEALSGMMALVNRGSSELDKMTKSFEKCDGSAKEMADTMLDNSKGAIESLTGSLESAGIAIQQALAPEIKDLSKWIQGLVDDFNDLSDEEKQNIVRTALLVASIGPAIKIFSKLTSGLGKVSKGIGIFSKAIAVAKNNTVSADVSVNNLAKRIGFLTTPTGIATTAIVGLTAATAAYYIAVAEEKTAMGGLRNEIEKQKSSWESLKETRNNTLNNSLNEIEITQKLADELRTFTNENGKVKQGYEDRAQVILNQLNKALGTEYKLNGNIIGQYKELRDNIDNLIAMKKAEAVLNAYQEEYGTAIKEQAKATENLIELKKQQKEAAEQMAVATGREKAEASNMYSYTSKKIMEQQELLSKYGKTIEDVEKLQTASASGSAQKIDEAITKMGTSYDRAKQMSQKSLTEQVKDQATYIQNIKNSLAEAETVHDTYQQSILNTQIETENKKLQELVNSLIEQTSTIQELTPEQIEAWKKLAEANFIQYSNSLMRVPEETRKKIEEATGIIAADVGLSNAAGEIGNNSTMIFGKNLKLSDKVTEMIKEAQITAGNNTTIETEFNKKGENAVFNFQKNINKAQGNSATSDYIAGAEQGLNNKKKSFLDLLFGIGRQGNQRMRDGLGDGSPSVLAKRALIDYFLGADIGIEQSAPNLVNKMQDYGSKINEQFTTALSHKNIQLSSKIPKITSKLIEKNKTIFTTPQIVFNVQKLDEEKLEQCFNYINKKFGSRY